MFEIITKEIQSHKLQNNAFVIGITGIDLSGKTEFTRALADYLVSKNYKVLVIHLDDFHNPRAYRNSGDNPVENYWQRNFNFEILTQELLIPIRQRRKYATNLRLLDLLSDKYDVQRAYSFDQDTIILLEGIFLFREEIAPYLDYKIFIDISFEESQRRATIRDVPIYGPEILKRYEEKYWPAQRIFLKEYPPLQIADLVIDNNNWEYPVIEKHASGASSV